MNSVVITEDEYSDDELTYFLVVVLNKDTEILVDLPSRNRYRFRDLRLKIEEKKNGDDPNLRDLSCQWRFMLNENTYVPLHQELEWNVNDKEFGLLKHTDGSFSQPHNIFIKDSW